MKARWMWSVFLLLVALPLTVCARSFPWPGDATEAEQQRFGATLTGYVALGCVPQASSTTTVTLPLCRAFVWAAGPPPVLQGFEEAAGRQVTLSGGDGTYLLLGRAHPGVQPVGATCTPGTHYCWTRGTPPAVPAGTTVLAHLTVSAGAVTAGQPAGQPATGVYHPAAFGATGDGVTDDTAAFLTLQAVMPPSGGVVQLDPTMTYHLNTAGGLVWTKPVVLRGAGMEATRLTCGTGIGNAACLTVRGARSVVSDLSLTGEQSNFTNGDIYLTEWRAGIRVEGADTWVERVQVTDAIVGIRFDATSGGGVRQSTLRNSLIKRGYATQDCNNSVGLHGAGVTDWTVQGNRVVGFGENINAHASSRYVRVLENYVQDPCDNGIYLATVEYSTVTANHLVDIAHDAIKVRGSVTTISGNTIVMPQAGRTGIAAHGATPAVNGINAGRVVISDNTLACHCGRGIMAGAESSVPDGGIRGLEITGNVVSMLGTGDGTLTSAFAGITVQGPGQNLTIANNIIHDAYERGITTQSVVGGVPNPPMRNVLLTGNQIVNVGPAGGTGLYKGLHLQEITGCVVSGNVIQNVLNDGIGIHLLTVQQCDIVNNTVGSTTTPPTTGTIVTESSGQAGLTNTYRNNRTTGVTVLTYNIASTSTSRVESNEISIGVGPLTSDFTIQPGQAQKWMFAPSGGTRTINVSAVWPVSEVMICNRSTDASNLTFAPLSDTITPTTCAWYLSSQPATFWRFAPAP